LHFTFAFRHAAHDFLSIGRLSPIFLRQYSTWRLRDGPRRLSALEQDGVPNKSQGQTRKKLTFRECLGADLAAERLGFSDILLAGNYSGYFRGWIHFDLTWGLFDTLVIAPGRNSPAIEDTTTFGKTVVLYMEMQRSDVMVNRGAQCYATSVPRLMI